MISRRSFLGSSGLLLAGGLLDGCGDRAPQRRAAAIDEGKPAYGGRLRLGIVVGNQSGNLDVHKPVGSGGIRGFALYAKLWEWNAQMRPALALAEEVDVSPDAKAWTIRLRQGLEFHHGKTITADDVLFSTRRLTDPELASPYASLLYAVDRDKLEKLDDRTVRVHFRDERGFIELADMWTNFGGIVPTDYHPVSNPVGAGPFMVKSFIPGQRVLLKRFANYFKSGKPYADELELVEFQDQTSRAVALRAGQIDLANAIQPEQVSLVRADPSLKVVVSRTSGWQSLDMNLQRAPFDDVRVRQAFRLLADRDELVARALNGYGRVANDLYAPHDPTFNHTIAQRPHDIVEAKSLLAAAGRANLSVELTASPAGISAALVFAEQAKRAGIDVRVNKVDLATFNGPRKNDWTFSTGGLLPESFLSSALHVDAPMSPLNRTNFRDARFGELFEQALQQPDVERRKVLVHEAQQIQHDSGGLLIWGFADTLDAVSRRVGGALPEQTIFTTWRFENLWINS